MSFGDKASLSQSKAKVSSILQEADKLLQSLASEAEDLLSEGAATGAGASSDTSNDAIAWSSDLQSVLSKLDMLETKNT